jgi:hypothetical protein
VTGDVREHDARVVPLPGMPVAAADAAGADADDHAARRRFRRRDLPHREGTAEAVEHQCPHAGQTGRTRRAASSRSV